MILARRFAEALLAGLAAGAVLLILAPVFIGWRPYTVLTGSMRPGVQPGDVVMDRPIRVSDMHVGDVVTFSDPTRKGVLVTHRVRAIAHKAEATEVETRGDANNASERWTIATKDRVGKVVYVIPKIGHVATIIRNPVGIIVLVVLPILGIAGGIIRKIWQDDEDEATELAGREPPPDDAESTGPADREPSPENASPDPGDAAERDLRMVAPEGAGSAPDR
ncbi:MAG: signal peptidase I [Solirubrobacteraceae bacterium]|nr:signal peptidase I [Solirubrobacteraceae bacterium]